MEWLDTGGCLEADKRFGIGQNLATFGLELNNADLHHLPPLLRRTSTSS